MGEARALAAERPWIRRHRRRRRGLRALPIRLLAVGSLGLVVAAAAWMVQQVRLNRPTVPKVAELAAGLPQAPAPKPVDGMAGVLDRAVDTIAFPDWTRFGWRPIGARRDEIAGRGAVTVFYAHGGRQLRYTIVSGTDPIDGASGRTVYRGQLALTFVGGTGAAMTLAFERQDRTVLLSAPGAEPEFGRTMLRLAAWRVGGRLAY